MKEKAGNNKSGKNWRGKKEGKRSLEGINSFKWKELGHFANDCKISLVKGESKILGILLRALL